MGSNMGKEVNEKQQGQGKEGKEEEETELPLCVPTRDFDLYEYRMFARRVLATGDWLSARAAPLPQPLRDQVDFYLSESGFLYALALGRLLAHTQVSLVF